MSSQAKAPSAGSKAGSGRSRGLFRRAFATRGASGEIKGSSALAARILGLAAISLAIFASFGAGSASALDRYFTEGIINKYDFGKPTGLAVDEATGNLLVADAGAGRVQVFGPGPVLPGSSALLSFSPGLASPYGIAVDQIDGSIYVSSPAGNEVQRVLVEGAAGGTYTLTFKGQTTPPIPFDASAEVVQERLEDLPTIGAGNVEVGTFVTFEGDLANTDLPLIEADGSALVDAPGIEATAKVNPFRNGGIDRIAKFAPDDRAAPTAYAPVPGFTSPTLGSEEATGEIGDFAAPLAVDPLNGDLIVADPGNNYVARFDSTGDFVGGFDGSDTATGPFKDLLSVAVGGGKIYVLDLDGSITADFPQVFGTVRLEEFDATGASLGQISGSGLNKAVSLAYGQVTNNLYVTEQGDNSTGAHASKLHVLHGGSPQTDIEYTESMFDGMGATAISEVEPARPHVYAGSYAGIASGWSGVFVVGVKHLPDVTLGVPTGISGGSADVSGTVDPVLGTANFHFEYSADGGLTWTPVADQSPAHGESSTVTQAEAEISGLEPAFTYQVRLIATNGDGESISDVRSFTTQAMVPVVVTGQATNRSDTGATLRGTIDPNGVQATYHFEYGLSTEYGSRVPLEYEATAGKGRTPFRAGQPVTGLQPGTTYHFRLVGQNSAGVEFGEDRTFTTLTPVEALHRGYELVSPAEKGGNNVKASFAMQASEDGNAMLFPGATVLPGYSDSAPAYPFYVSQRDGENWTTKGTDPPQTPGPSAVKYTFGVSDDGTKAVVGSLQVLSPGAVDGQPNIYLKDLAANTYELMATIPDLGWWANQIYTGNGLFADGTPNFDRVLLWGGGTYYTTLLPDAPYGALYEFTDGQLTIASRNSAGEPVLGSGIGPTDRDKHVISSDGHRVIFQSEGFPYIRTDGVSEVISESHLSSDDPGTFRPANIAGADRELRHIYLLAQPLVDSATPDTLGLYRYDTESETLSLLADSVGLPGPGAEAIPLQTSRDGSSFYFASPLRLTPDTPDLSAGRYVYVWHGGAISYIAGSTVAYSSGEEVVPARWASANGRYFVFITGMPGLTDYDVKNPSSPSGTFAQLYRFDVENKELICVSCRPDGKKPTAPAYIGPILSDTATHNFVRAVNDKGRVFFESVEQLVPGDVNSVSDIYEYDPDVGNRLITSGRGTGSQLAEVSLSGNDVFFTTKDRLVGIDRDKATDVYDARVDGGLASQNPPVPREECIRDDCKAVPNGGPELPFGGSEALKGPENVSEAPRKRCGKGRHARKVKGKSRCVKQGKAGKTKSRSNDNRRQGR